MIHLWRLGICVLEIIMISSVAISVRLRFLEKTAHPFSVVNNRWISVFFLSTGILFSLPCFLSQENASAFFCLFSIPVLYSALVAANQRVLWDNTGFWYRTAFYREIRYDFSDVRQIRPVGMGRIGPDLFVNVNGRRFFLDETTPWERFASAYADWQTRNNHPSWRKKLEDRFLTRYRRHGPFGKKLDRVPYSRFFIGLSVVLGIILSVLSISILVTVSKPVTVILAVITLLIGLYLPLGFLYAIAHIVDKPNLIRRWIRVKIRPDPDHPVKKIYRKRQR